MASITPPTDYDEAKAQGWEYHRNGVAGWGFYVRVDDHGDMTVVWPEDDDDGEFYEAHHVVNLPKSMLDAFAGMPAKEDEAYEVTMWRHTSTVTPVAVMLDSDAVVVWHDSGQDARFITVFSGDGEPNDYMVASFNLDRLLRKEVRFGSNSWRGDVHADSVARLLGGWNGWGA